MTAIRIVLADDHLLVRAGVRSLLEAIDGTKVVGEAGNGREVLALAKSLDPDLVVMDITMRELNGIDATAQLRAASPRTRVLILSMHSSEEFLLRAIRAGANGYVVKDAAPDELASAVAAVMRGEVYLSTKVSGHALAALRHPPAARRDGSIDSLSARQREILQLVAEGKSTKEIAFILDVSVKTVETHRAAVMERLGIRDIAGLVVYAIRNHLIDIDQHPH